VTYSFGFLIESLVAILLLLTIAYCVILNNRLKRLKADEQSLKATIAELITATEIAERAVAGLRTTAQECDSTLGERLRNAEGCCSELSEQIKAGDVLMKRLSRIVAAARPGEGAPEPTPTPANKVSATKVPATKASDTVAPAAVAPDPKALAAAAQAFAERARARLEALAA
jgi:Domain of unknown function (DUF6468)